MTRVLLVRHARPASTWEESTDAPLDPVGIEQAEALAARLEARGPLPVATSPLRRARETAAPLARRWGLGVRVVETVGEVPSPIDEPSARGAWLRTVLAQRWGDVDPLLHDWRARLLAGIAAFDTDTVVFTHYVAINTAVGAATGDERLVCCQPAHASVTELEIGPDGTLTLVALDDPHGGPPVDSPL